MTSLSPIEQKITQLGREYGYFWLATTQSLGVDQEPAEDRDNRIAFTTALMSLVESYADQKLRDYVEPHIKHCEDQNGLSFCKSCQLTRPGEES